MKTLPSINPKQEVEKITIFLKKTFKDQKIDKVVIGLSGGIDSTVVFYLLKKVLPLENIFAVQMDYIPRKKLNIDLKGISVVNIPIKKVIDQLEKSVVKDEGIGPRRGGKASAKIKKFDTEPLKKVRVGNIMARIRMTVLFDLSKQIGGLVCGTENKSEKLLGYFTRFGDAASDIEPLSHLYKTQVFQLAKYLKIPKTIITQSPTAGLWDGQTDEDDFGFTYREADQVLYLFNDKKIKIKEINKYGFRNAEKIIKRLHDNRFKNQVPYSLEKNP